MHTPRRTPSGRWTRRELLRGSGIALGALTLGPGRAGAAADREGPCYPPAGESSRQRYSYFDQLPPLRYYQDRNGFLSGVYPPLEPNEMRITFMGSSIPPVRRAQQMMSIFVEVGWDPKRNRALDEFVFDCGSGVAANFGAMEVGYGRMDKLFVTHLHGDHVSDLTHIYCFGCSADRLTPMYVFGQGPSGVRSPRPPHPTYDDGTHAFCRNLRDALRWHTESFSFQPTTYAASCPTPGEIQQRWGLPVLHEPVADDPWGDGYAMVPIELDWRKVGAVAYDNRATGVRITHSEVWAMQVMHLPKPLPPGVNQQWDECVARTITVQDGSHTPQGAFGYLLGQIQPRPRLTVATHFPVSDDTVDCALASVRKHVPGIGALGERLTFSVDRMVISAYAGGGITQRRGEVLEFGSSPLPPIHGDEGVPKYHDAQGRPDPYAQIDRSQEIQAGPDTYCRSGY
jgi:ribonuclease Z